LHQKKYNAKSKQDAKKNQTNFKKPAWLKLFKQTLFMAGYIFQFN